MGQLVESDCELEGAHRFARVGTSPALARSKYVVPDTFCDPVNKKLRSLNALKSCTAAKYKLKDELVSLLKSSGYVEFSCNSKAYPSMYARKSLLYDVPLNRRSHLSKFRGQRTRFVCVGGYKFKRYLFAGPVDSVPSLSYVFQDIEGRTVAYFGRRFMTVELTAEDPWERTDEGSPDITSARFDYLLPDGKHAAEFTGLKRLDDGSLLGSLLDIGGGTVFSSIREAITGLEKESAAYEKSLGF